MRYWLQRLVALVLLSGGLAAVFLPFELERRFPRVRIEVRRSTGAVTSVPGTSRSPAIEDPETFAELDGAIRTAARSGKGRSAVTVDRYVYEEWLWRCFRADLYDPVHLPIAEDQYQVQSLEAPASRWVRQLGAVALALGFLAAAGLYLPARRGWISIASWRIALLYDVIGIAVLTPFAWPALDLLIAHFCAVEPDVLDDFMRFMGVFMLAVGVPVLSLFTTAVSTQRLRIDAAGIAKCGMIGQTSFTWEQVDDLQPGELSAPIERGGIWAPKQVMRTLTIEGKEDSITIIEPPSRSTRRRLVDQLQQHAPERLQEQVQSLAGQWDSLWR